MWMCIIIAIYQQDPVMGTASLDKGGALNVLGAVRGSCLKIFYYLAAISCSKLFQLMVVLGGKNQKYLWTEVFAGSTL